MLNDTQRRQHVRMFYIFHRLGTETSLNLPDRHRRPYGDNIGACDYTDFLMTAELMCVVVPGPQVTTVLLLAVHLCYGQLFGNLGNFRLPNPLQIRNPLRTLFSDPGGNPDNDVTNGRSRVQEDSLPDLIPRNNVPRLRNSPMTYRSSTAVMEPDLGDGYLYYPRRHSYGRLPYLSPRILMEGPLGRSRLAVLPERSFFDGPGSDDNGLLL